MGKALVIAEKPSVAADIARALKIKKTGDHYENDQFVVSSAVGHLLELEEPPEYQVQRGKWTFAHLPVLPDHFNLRPIEKTKTRLAQLARLIQRKDIDRLINACDAGREGELIFRNIVRHTKARQPIQRLWLQSMTPAAIRDGFEHLRSDEAMQPLSAASYSRAEADWLVGINGTRAMTAFNSKAGGFYKTTVGRVQTPTLAIVVEREQKIRAFKPRDYWEVVATFGAAAGDYTGRWFDEAFQKTSGKNGDPELRPERLWDQARAEAIRAKCEGQPGQVTEESKPATQLSPLLFDLTTLQREANSRFGFPARMTLQIAQALYERHKVLTYPRTDSRHLPEDYLTTVRQTLDALQQTAFAPFAGKILAKGWVRPNKRIFNNAKVSDHFAIIPTGELPKNLSDTEAKLFDMVARRFLAVFYPAAEYLETTRITRVVGEPFKTSGKVLVKPGWLEVYGRETVPGEETGSLTPVQPGEQVATRAIEVCPHQTRPPQRFTEATLLSAMEGAGKLVEDEELRTAMSERGLGTPATRAAIIEGLIAEDYLHRAGRELVPTAKAFSLMQLLNGLSINELTRPELTGEWEFKLKNMERGQLDRETFMEEIRRFTAEIVAKARRYDKDTIPGDFGVLKTPCPRCGGEVHERFREFRCVADGCDFTIRKILSGRMFEPEEIEALLRDRQIGPLQGFRSKKGFPFAAVVQLTPELGVRFDFGQEEKTGVPDEEEPVDFTGREPLGKCPKCGARVFENGMSYVCEKAVGAARSCDFKMGAVILQQRIDARQMSKLLADGRTEPLTGFVSKKNHRKFEACLVLKDGAVGFEFPAREKRGVAKAAKAKAPAPVLDFSGQEPVGKCPMCGGNVFEAETQYVCENTQRERKPCKFKSGKTILGQAIGREQMTVLLGEGRTEPLSGFVSKRGNRFTARLVIDDRKRVGFEFDTGGAEEP